MNQKNLNIQIPKFSMVVLVGVSSSGKSSFARQFFKSTEVISSDFCRGLVSDDENNLEATQDAFDLLHYMVGKRLKRKKLVVIDATNLQESARQKLLQISKEYHCLPVAIVMKTSEELIYERHEQRSDRDFGTFVLRKQLRSLKRSLKRLKKEGFRYIFTLDDPEQLKNLSINRTKLWNDKQEETGPFDIIGDVHGCFEELKTLLEKLGYQIRHTGNEGTFGYEVVAAEGRKAVFVGDLVDRGPASDKVLRLVMSMVENGTALCVPGNHDMKLLKKLNGKRVKIQHGLAETLEQLEKEPSEFIEKLKAFLNSLISHYVLDQGKLVVAHAGLREDMIGRASGTVRAFCLYGETSGEIDEFGLPVRYNWAQEYDGKAMVVYGHTPIPEPEWLNNTINIDTGCVFGGKLTALRYPEKELVSVKTEKVYAEPIRPLEKNADQRSAQQAYDDLLDMEDVSGKRILNTKYAHPVTIWEQNSAAALEIMSRFALDPKWLIYLPPTMSPTDSAALDGLLEHPAEAFDYYRQLGVQKLICEKKHMGSRAVVIIGKTPEALQQRFGFVAAHLGTCYTRTGRRFFTDEKLEAAFLERLHKALCGAGFWAEHETDWVCLDCELMPWSAKAQSLISSQYAAVGASGQQSMNAIMSSLTKATKRELPVEDLFARFQPRQQAIQQFTKAYSEYCKATDGLEGIVLAPFHILATEGKVHSDKPHTWHMDTIAAFCKQDPEFLMATPYRLVDLLDEETISTAIAWWTQMTSEGGEGMVVKPLSFIARGEKSLIQPAIKCRGPEYLRIIYGPDYLEQQNLGRLKKRGVGKKRSLALKEFSLGLEALDRFVDRQPLRKVHECVFGVLALESEPVDPRL